MEKKAPRTRMNAEARREELLAFGRRLFGEKAYEQVSMDDVAEAAKISKGLLYHYFPTKRDYYLETLREAADELVLTTDPDPALTPMERLRTGMSDHLAYVQANAATYRRVMGSASGMGTDVKEIVDIPRNVLISRVLDGLGVDEADDFLMVSLLGWIGFVEATSLAWLDRPDLSDKAMLKLIMLNLAASVGATGRVSLDAHVPVLLQVLAEPVETGGS